MEDLLNLADLKAIPGSSEEGGFQPYALDLAEAGIAEEEDVTGFALVVFVRQDGVMLALPEHVVSPENLELGKTPGHQGMVGPSTLVEVRASKLHEEVITHFPIPGDGRVVRVLLVDFTAEILAFLRPLESRVDIDLVHTYDLAEPSFVPTPSELITVALAWVEGVVEGDSDRLQFYSADDVPEELPPQSPARRKGRTKAGPAGFGGAEPSRTSPKRRPTVAQLAESLEAITQTLPNIALQLQDLTARTQAMEAGGPRLPDRPSALRAPLGSSATLGSPGTSSAAALVQTMPPPKSMSAQPKARVTFSPTEVIELEKEFAGVRPTSPRP